jgi:hypothetical protein
MAIPFERFCLFVPFLGYFPKLWRVLEIAQNNILVQFVSLYYSFSYTFVDLAPLSGLEEVLRRRS